MRHEVRENAGAEPRQGLPQRLIRDTAGERFRRRLGGHVWHAGRLPGGGPCRDRTLFQSDPGDAAPAEMGIDALDDHGGEMLQLKRESGLDPDNERCRSYAVVSRAVLSRGGHCSLTGCDIAASRSPAMASQNKIRSVWPKPCRATTGSIAV